MGSVLNGIVFIWNNFKYSNRSGYSIIKSINLFMSKIITLNHIRYVRRIRLSLKFDKLKLKYLVKQ